MPFEVGRRRQLNHNSRSTRSYHSANNVAEKRFCDGKINIETILDNAVFVRAITEASRAGAVVLMPLSEAVRRRFLFLRKFAETSVLYGVQKNLLNYSARGAVIIAFEQYPRHNLI